MDRLLEDTLKRYGWDALYEEYVPGLGPQTGRGERRACSPFPFANDSNPSFTVNVFNGLWQCLHSGLAGNYVQLVAWMNAQLGEDGKPVDVDFKATERQIRLRFGIGKPVDASWLTECVMALKPGSPNHVCWSGRKPWNQYVLQQLGVGYSQEHSRVVFPCHDRPGTVVNCRMYKPFADRQTPKTVWYLEGMQDNFLFPHLAWRDDWVVLVEGEPDAVSLRCFGIPGASGTLGSGNPVPEGLWWRGKTVYVWMDDDQPGRDATKKAVEVMRSDAAKVMICRTPDWAGKPTNADPSGYIMYLLGLGNTPEQVQSAIRDVLATAQPAPAVHHVYDATPLKSSFGSALTSAYSGTRIAFDAHVSSISSSKYRLPTRVVVKCPASGHRYCASCPMKTHFHGSQSFAMDPRSHVTLRIINEHEDNLAKEVRSANKIPPQCPDVTIEAVESIDVEAAILTSTIAEARQSSEAVEKAELRRHEAFILNRNGKRLEEGTDFNLRGFVYSMPRTQKQVFVIDSYEAKSDRYDRFEPTLAEIEELRAFSRVGTPWDTLHVLARDMSSAFTGIVDRDLLHIMYGCMWHSVIDLGFAGRPLNRGWLELLIVGDTRCGKSATFKHMARVLGTGMLIDSKNQTIAGLLGAVEQSTITGERYVSAGLFPRNDRRGPILMDEFAAGHRWDAGPGIMDHLSSMRAEGMVTITKAANAQMPARVRAAYSANPGMGRLMSELPGYGVEVIPHVIRQPEDIARFDAAMVVTQQDVDEEKIYSLGRPTEPRFDQRLRRMLLRWAWSRSADQVQWGPGAEEAVRSAARQMCKSYSSSIPLVESSEQRNRLARMAASVAAQCFSTEDGLTMLVLQEHVAAAYWLMTSAYNAEHMGYDRYSHSIRVQNEITDESVVMDTLKSVYGDSLLAFAEQMLRLRDFQPDMLAMLAKPTMAVSSGDILKMLVQNRCARQARGGFKAAYECTPAFITLLRKIAEGKP